jgi:hypothetical protein
MVRFLVVSLLMFLVVQSRRLPPPKPCRREPLKLRGVVILREGECGANLSSGSDPFVATTEGHIDLPDERKLVDSVAGLTRKIRLWEKPQKGFHIGGLNPRRVANRFRTASGVVSRNMPWLACPRSTSWGSRDSRLWNARRCRQCRQGKLLA